MDLTDQLHRLVTLGVPALAGRSEDDLLALGDDLSGQGLVCIHPGLVRPSQLTPLLRRGERPGFVVEDMTDLDDFATIGTVDVPHRGLYLLRDVERGDEYRGVTPDDALPQIESRGRTPLTVNEGISWLLQDPDVLVDNHCFMCLGSRRAKGEGLDPRTPAIWISRGTGRDGAARKGAPKVGWCWSRNHHTWLGSASAAGRDG